MTDHLSRVVLIPHALTLLRQATALRTDTPRMPEATGSRTGLVAAPEGAAPSPAAREAGLPERPIRLLVLGDSTSTGVGTELMSDSLAPRMAEAIAAREGRDVDWTTLGKSGARTEHVLADWLPRAEEASREHGAFDLVYLTCGVNDALRLRGAGTTARRIRRIVRRLRAANPEARILVSSMPAFFRFARMPEPLRSDLHRHSQAIEARIRSTLDGMPGVEVSPPPAPYTEGFFATDHFHPSAQGYRDWANYAVAQAPDWRPAGASALPVD